MYIKTTISGHAKQRVLERLGETGLADLTQNFSFNRSTRRYVDCVGRQHVFNSKYNIEVVGQVRHGWFIVFTVIKVTYQQFCDRESAMVLQRY
jgi:hypothetical protein